MDSPKFANRFVADSRNFKGIWEMMRVLITHLPCTTYSAPRVRSQYILCCVAVQVHRCDSLFERREEICPFFDFLRSSSKIKLITPFLFQNRMGNEYQVQNDDCRQRSTRLGSARTLVQFTLSSIIDRSGTSYLLTELLCGCGEVRLAGTCWKHLSIAARYRIYLGHLYHQRATQFERTLKHMLSYFFDRSTGVCNRLAYGREGPIFGPIIIEA